MNIFNPFNKEFSNVEEDDLEILKNTAEGWHIEYKREFPNAKVIAKSISSFANSHGGIFFIGISSDSKTNYATEFIGVDDDIDRIRDSVRGNLQPFPYFETYTIQLKNKNNILMAVIPQGENTPYIHNDGRIYRRNSSASDPISENNRHSIDILYNNSKLYYKKIKEFRNIDYDLSFNEKTSPYISLFINTTPFNHFNFKDFYNKEFQSKLLEHFNSKFVINNIVPDLGSQLEGKSKRFNTITPYINSYSLRNLQYSVELNGLTAELDEHGNFKAMIPLSTNSYESCFVDGEFSQVVSEKGFKNLGSIKLISLQNIFKPIIELIFLYLKYLEKHSFNNNIQFCFKTNNCSQTLIYSRSKEYLNYIKNYGFPICMKSSQFFPEQGLEYSFKDITKDPFSNIIQIFSLYTTSLGLSSEVSLKSIIYELNTPDGDL